MGMKRTVTWENGPAPPPKRQNLTAKVNRIQKTLNERKPEMKWVGRGSSGTLAAGAIANLELSAIAQGDATNERSGSQIKIHYITYSMSVANATSAAAGVDLYLLTSKDASLAPVYATFNPYPGGTCDRRLEMLWKQHVTNGPDNNGNILSDHSFKFPMKCYFSGAGTTACVKNRTYLTVKNSTGSSVNYQISANVFYTDV